MDSLRLLIVGRFELEKSILYFVIFCVLIFIYFLVLRVLFEEERVKGCFGFLFKLRKIVNLSLLSCIC